MDNQNNEEVLELIASMFQAKVWDESVTAFQEMGEDEQNALLAQFERICDEHGENSNEMFNFFESVTRRMSKTYYFVKTLGVDEPNWDKALEDEMKGPK